MCLFSEFNVKKRLSLPFSLLLIVIYYHYRWNFVYVYIDIGETMLYKNFIQIICANKIVESTVATRWQKLFHNTNKRKDFDSTRARTYKHTYTHTPVTFGSCVLLCFDCYTFTIFIYKRKTVVEFQSRCSGSCEQKLTWSACYKSTNYTVKQYAIRCRM